MYLGHIASGEGLRTNPDKVEAIKKWPSCTNISEVRGFLNIAGYYRKFIWGFVKEASPLYKLLEGSPRRGTPIQWDNNCEQAMNRLKAALTSADLLTHPVPWRLFVIDTDASGNCLGAVLQQSRSALAKPIAFESRRITPTEQRYSAQEREMLAIVDHESLKHFLTQKNLGRRLARFADDIAHFNVEIIYRLRCRTLRP